MVGWVVVASLVLLRQFHLAVVAGSLVETRQPLNQSKTALRPGRYRAIGKMCRLGVPLASTGEGPPLLGYDPLCIPQPHLHVDVSLARGG